MCASVAACASTHQGGLNQFKTWPNSLLPNVFRCDSPRSNSYYDDLFIKWRSSFSTEVPMELPIKRNCESESISHFIFLTYHFVRDTTYTESHELSPLFI